MGTGMFLFLVLVVFPILYGIWALGMGVKSCMDYSKPKTTRAPLPPKKKVFVRDDVFKFYPCGPKE